jgi:MoaA/NifB/PqqE/SkfB family radical SAM enzyme
MRPFSWLKSVALNRWSGVPKPSWCTYIVTYRCNARCKMCDSWRMKPGDEMAPDAVADVFRKLGRLDVVRLTGGEPFLRQDLLQVAEAVQKASRPGVLHITTNGSWPLRVFDFVTRFSKPRRLRIMVSFDGLELEHDANRGKVVPFAKAIETVRGLTQLRAAYGVQVSANHTVISPQSLEDNAGLRQVLGELGVEVHSVLAYADSAMYGAKLRGDKAEHLIVPTGYPLHPKLDGADVVGFVERELQDVGSYRSRLLRVGKRYYLKGLLSRLRGEANPKPRPRCVALRSHIRLLPDGSVPVCQFNTQTVGNLQTDSFAAVWNNGHSAGARDWVDRCPGCWAECEVVPNALYSADILRSVRK